MITNIKKELDKMAKKEFCVDTQPQPDGYHEVHVLDETCTHLPDEKNRKHLGFFEECDDAIKKAKKYYEKVDGCFYCCYEWHTR